MEWTPLQQQRYDRHIRLEGFGHSGQTLLKQSRIICVGAGGLGCVSLAYLAAAGVGTITIIDFDRIELSNLQRQILFTTNDVGKYKAKTLAKRLQQLNDDIEIFFCNEKITVANAAEQLRDADLIMDASDNFATRYLINDVCSYLHKPFVAAAIDQFNGQCLLLQPDQIHQPCYRCLFPEKNRQIPDCNQAGVLGVLPGIIGTLQAQLAIYALLGRQEYYNKMFYYQGEDVHWQTMDIQPDKQCMHDYHGRFPVYQSAHHRYLTRENLQHILRTGETIYLVDVREAEEFQDAGFVQAILLPLSLIKHDVYDLLPDKNAPLVLYCKTGARSTYACELLQQQGYTHVRILEGGMVACMQDTRMMPYIRQNLSKEQCKIPQ